MGPLFGGGDSCKGHDPLRRGHDLYRNLLHQSGPILSASSHGFTLTDMTKNIYISTYIDGKI